MYFFLPLDTPALSPTKNRLIAVELSLDFIKRDDLKMTDETSEENSLEKLISDLKAFIRLSLNEDKKSIQDWIKEVSSPVESFCHSRTDCNETECLAFQSECGRCWLQVGTLCGGVPQGKFADKYELCTECKVYKEYVGGDPIRNLRELVLTLVHSLNLRQAELEVALDEVKTLQGFIPICSSCKSIRDDKGYWNKIESYISNHSEAEFTHSCCPDCIRKLYPDLADEMIAAIEKNQ